MRLPGILLAALALACRAPSPVGAAAAPQAEEAPVEASPAPPVREADRVMDTGVVLRSHADGDFGLHLRTPVKVAWTRFDLAEGLSLDDLATLAAIPTVELVVPLSERWTLLPFVGMGAAYQNGDSDLVGGDQWLGLSTGGVRATRWQHFGGRYWFGLMAEARYSAALSGRDGVLGDWGSFDGALELRRDFGTPRGEPRFQGGLYAQGFYYWDDLELDIAGAEAPALDGNAEIGISLGTTEPVHVWGFKLPRVFVGAIVGDLLSGVRIRFGRL